MRLWVHSLGSGDEVEPDDWPTKSFLRHYSRVGSANLYLDPQICSAAPLTPLPPGPQAPAVPLCGKHPYRSAPQALAHSGLSQSFGGMRRRWHAKCLQALLCSWLARPESVIRARPRIRKHGFKSQNRQRWHCPILQHADRMKAYRRLRCKL
jgi:hypothetical protein